MNRQNFENLNRKTIRRDQAQDGIRFLGRGIICLTGMAIFLILVSLDPMGAVVEHVLDARGH